MTCIQNYLLEAMEINHKSKKLVKLEHLVGPIIKWESFALFSIAQNPKQPIRDIREMGFFRIFYI